MGLSGVLSRSNNIYFGILRYSASWRQVAGTHLDLLLGIHPDNLTKELGFTAEIFGARIRLEIVPERRKPCTLTWKN